MTTISSAWKRQGTILAVLLLLLGIAYYASFESIVAIWLRSDTFAHGFIIAPITLWLIWRIRQALLAIEPQVNFIGIPLLIGLGVIWLLATYIDILVIEQLAAVAMIPALVFTALGWKATTAMAFPLIYLMLAVPMGEELTPYLIDFTADFTVMMVKVTGIPIYREGNFLQLPSGNWSVVAACSGVRYLIASVALGLLYAYLNYQGVFKRGVFITASFVVPIFANGLRAFIIVMLGHMSDMKLATGVDHLIYGWFFFGIVIAIMFYVGSFWRDETSATIARGVDFRFGNLGSITTTGKLTTLLAAVVLMIWPVRAQLEKQEFYFDDLEEITVIAPDGWNETADEVGWKPAYNGMDREFSGAYINSDGQMVWLYIGYYAEQRQGAELGNYNNVLVTEKDKAWRTTESGTKALRLSGSEIHAPATTLVSARQRLMTISLYYVDGQVLTNKYTTKLFQAKAKLLGEPNDGAALFISAPYEENRDAGELIEKFTIEALPSIRTALDDMRRES